MLGFVKHHKMAIPELTFLWEPLRPTPSFVCFWPSQTKNLNHYEGLVLSFNVNVRVSYFSLNGLQTSLSRFPKQYSEEKLSPGLAKGFLKVYANFCSKTVCSIAATLGC